LGSTSRKKRMWKFEPLRAKSLIPLEVKRYWWEALAVR
jgi:hypothetical protein